MIAAVPVATCKVCKQVFERRSTMHVVCSYPCTVKLAKAKEREAAESAKAERRATRGQREALKPRSQWLNEAQVAFNAYVRARDELAGLPCVSCLRHHKGSWDAGHYLTRGARPELRFDEQNCWRQCVPCNQHLHGNLVLYRLELVMRIGATAVARLEGPHPPRKYSVDELREIRDTYRAKARGLKKQLEAL
jgi:hypothetical protein